MAIPGSLRVLVALIPLLVFTHQLYPGSSAPPHIAAFNTRGAVRPVFIENRGQFDPRVRFQVRIRNQAVWLTDEGLTFDILRSRRPHADTTSEDKHDKSVLEGIERFTFRAEFVGCLKPSVIERLPELPGAYNFFSADAKRSRSKIHAYSGVIYRGVWKGIDLKLYSKDGSNLEQEFVVHRGADLKQIRVRYQSVQGIDVSPEGSLRVKTDTGTLNESAPVLYATSKGIRRLVHGRFVLLGPTEYGFQTDSTADADELVVDPTVLFSTYLGGSNVDSAAGIAVDDSGVYVTGTTSSSNFPETNVIGPPSVAVFVAKLSPDGTRLIYSTLLESGLNAFIGQYHTTAAGSAGRAIALNSAGEVYIAGLTANGPYPTTPGAFRSCSGSAGFISKLSAGGDQLLYSSCLSSSVTFPLASLAVSANDRVYMVGTTTGGALPVTPGAYQASCTPAGPNICGYLGVFDTANSGAESLVYSTYLGPPTTFATGVAVDGSGAAYLTGETWLPGFPVTAGTLQSTCPEIRCAFVTKIDPSIGGPAGLISSTLFGKTSSPSPAGIALDSVGNVYIAGVDSYNPAGFPTTPGSFQPTPSDPQGAQGFVTKFGPMLNQVLYSTFLGGTGGGGRQQIFALDVDSAGRAAVTGSTSATGFPVTPDAFQPNLSTSGTDADAFLTVFSADGSQLVYSTFLGGPNGDDAGAAVTFASTGDVYVAGDTDSPFFHTTPGTYQEKYSVGEGSCVHFLCSDGFVTGFPLGSSFRVLNLSINSGGNFGTVTPTVYGSGFQNGATVTLVCDGVSIVGTNTAVGTGGLSLTATFNLRGVSPGTCTVKVVDPNGSAATLASGFTVLPGGVPNVSVSIVGRDLLRAGETQQYFIVCSNAGNVDAIDVPLWMTFPNFLGYDSDPSTLADYSQFQGDTVVMSGIFTLPAGSSKSIPINITAPDEPQFAHQIFQFHAWTRDVPDSVSNERAPMSAIGQAAVTFSGWREALDAIIHWVSDVSPYTLEEPAGVVVDIGIHLPQLGICGVIDMVALKQRALGISDVNSVPEILPFDDPRYTTLGNVKQQLQTAAGNEGLVCGTAPSTSSVKSTEIVTSGDPNDKAGLPGIGKQQYVPSSTPLNYSIFFGNEPTASAPAQAVTITDPLPVASDDLATFSFGPITFGNHLLTPRPGTNYSTTVDLRPAVNLLVGINATLDSASAMATWKFTSLDPSTGKPTTDPRAGFLPPGGNGSVFFTVMPKHGLPTNTHVQNRATVVFDKNALIPTPTWSNTLDSTAPTSQVATLPATENTSCFLLKWSGSDIGAGLASFTIFASDNGGPYAPWLSMTTSSTTVFNGQAGHSYSFYSQTIDLVGNVEAAKTNPEAMTTVAVGATCDARPTLAGAVTGNSRNGTAETVILQFTNSGVGTAQRVSIDQIAFRTLAGTGNVTLSDPALPDTLGSLAADVSTSVTLTLNVPLTVKEFSIEEQGTLMDVKGSTYKFSVGQAVFP